MHASGTFAQVPDMSAAPQCASGANEQYSLAAHCTPAMPPHILGGALASLAATGAAALGAAACGLVLGAAVALAIAGVVGFCAAGVAGVQPTLSQHENETNIAEARP